MVPTDVRVVPPTRRCVTVLYGITAVSSLLEVVEEPLDDSTPMTWSGTPLSVTVCPTALLAPKSCCDVEEPSTTTAAAFVSSAAVMNRPLSSVRALTSNHDGVVPTTLVVQ